MVRRTPIPLLRDLAANTLVIRCGMCKELVLLPELCDDSMQALLCPRRALVDQAVEPDMLTGGLRLPLLSARAALDA